MRRMCCVILFGMVGPTWACSGNDRPGDPPELPKEPPTDVSMVATGQFDSPMDAVASPDGSMFYFTAHRTGSESSESAAVFSVPAVGGSETIVFHGTPLEDPGGLLMSCDGSFLIVADLSYRGGDTNLELESPNSPLYRLDLESKRLSRLDASGVGEAAGVAMGPDCETLFVTGYDVDGNAALFRLPLAGGVAEVVKAGSPLRSPSGVYVDADQVAWVMDQLPEEPLGGALWAITPDGTTTSVVDQLELSEPAGVSLTAGGGTAVIPTLSEDGRGQLLTVDIASGTTTIVESEMVEPAGLRTAREAGVFAIADSNSDAIYRAQ